MEEIELYNMNGYFISKPLSLLVGSYTVEKFLVVDATDHVMYASPLEGSALAYLVNDPLPINFTLSEDEVLKLVPEVLSTENVTPEDFGYTTFSFDIVETFDFLLSVFVYNETVQNFELTDAMLGIYAEGNSIYLDTLAAITNQIKINDGFDSYILTVTKVGYTSYVDTFNNAELKLYFKSEDNGPLIVILEKSETFLCGENVTFTYNGAEVTYGTVVYNGKCWMDRNVGASQVASAFDDEASYGDYFQWGREADGHQLITSSTTNILALAGEQPGHSNFITANTSPVDWNTDNSWETRWIDESGNKTEADPCPDGWRVPTSYEWYSAVNVEALGNRLDAFNSVLKLPSAGCRYNADGSIFSEGYGGFYWSSTSAGNGQSLGVYFELNSLVIPSMNRTEGRSVRCIKN